MKFVLGLIVGLFIAITAGAYALSDSEVAKSVQRDLINEVNDIVRSNCDVFVDYPRRVFGNRCYRRDVMTGIEGDYLLCSRVSVECFANLQK